VKDRRSETMGVYVVYTTAGIFLGRVRASDEPSAIRNALARVNRKHHHVSDKACRAKAESEWKAMFKRYAENKKRRVS
jgi:hypothetical protein